jgi:hypothetical protein
MRTTSLSLDARRVARRLSLILALALLVICAPAFAQQTYVSQFDAYIGYAFLNSPSISLFENGFHFQFGYNPKTWVALGFDYSRATGDLTLVPNLLLPSLQQALAAQLAALEAAGKLPPGYTLSVPTASVTQTFAAGPQLMIRHWKPVTLFVRPSIGAIHERATPHPADPIAAAIVAQLAPGGNKTDWVGFYGGGGGVDFNLHRHFGVRVQVDFVHDYLFSDLLASSRNTVRFSVGPSFRFGKNIVR